MLIAYCFQRYSSSRTFVDTELFRIYTLTIRRCRRCRRPRCRRSNEDDDDDDERERYRDVTQLYDTQ